MRSLWQSPPAQPITTLPMISAHYGCQAGSLFIQHHQANTLSVNLHILLLNDDTFGSLTLTAHDTTQQGLAMVCSIIKNKDDTCSFRFSQSNKPAQSLDAHPSSITLLKLSEAVKAHINELIESHYLLTADDTTKRAMHIVRHCYQLTCLLPTTVTNEKINHLLTGITNLLDQETFDLMGLKLLDEINSETPRTCLK